MRLGKESESRQISSRSSDTVHTNRGRMNDTPRIRKRISAGINTYCKAHPRPSLVTATYYSWVPALVVEVAARHVTFLRVWLLPTNHATINSAR